MVNALLSQLFLECVAGLNDRKGCIFTNDMKLTRENMKYFVHIVCNEIQVKVNLKITTFFFYLRFPYCPNFFWFGVVPAKPVWLLLANHIFTLCYTWHFPWRADKIRRIFQTALAFRMYGLYMYGMFMCFIFSLSVLFSVNLVTCLNSWAAL